MLDFLFNDSDNLFDYTRENRQNRHIDKVDGMASSNRYIIENMRDNLNLLRQENTHLKAVVTSLAEILDELHPQLNIEDRINSRLQQLKQELKSDSCPECERLHHGRKSCLYCGCVIPN